MSILDKIIGTEEPHISVHEFNAVMLGWLLDDFTSAQAQTAIEFLFGFTLSAGEITTLQEFRTRFDGLTTDGKNAYWHRFEAYTLLVQVGAMTAAQYRTLMGIT